MHIQTVLKALHKRDGYYGVVYKLSSEILTEEDICKLAALLIAVLRYRKVQPPSYVWDIACGCFKYPLIAKILDAGDNKCPGGGVETAGGSGDSSHKEPLG